MLHSIIKRVLTNATELRYYKSMKNDEIIASIIKEHRLRSSKTRRALLRIFLERPIPLSVPQIQSELTCASLQVNKTTVYRELEVLEYAGIVHSLSLQDRRQYYELSLGEHHHHLVCLRCERIEDVDVDESGLLEEGVRVSREKNFSILRHSLEFFGLCKLCS
jgi:Fe2+ or Zn2+ uptake regulation protein